MATSEESISANLSLPAGTPPLGVSQQEIPDTVSILEFAQTEDAHITNDHSSPQPNWLRRNMMKFSAAAFVGGVAFTLATSSFEHLEHRVEEKASWVVGGVATTELMWLGGAAAMAVGGGRKIGNPLTVRSRWNQISSDVVGNNMFKVGLAINTVGALGSAGILVAGATTTLPVEAWPGAIGLGAADMASTLALRAIPYTAMRRGNMKVTEETKNPPKPRIRKAMERDIDRLADIDLSLFKKAYGETLPKKKEVMEMLTKRLHNSPDWMFIAEMDGTIEGFVCAFRTNTPLEKFVSWEQSTANGTLDNKVDPNGKYGYVVNMTIKPSAVKAGAEDMLLAHLFANGIEAGLEYAYFVSRMPLFKRWLANKNITPNRETASMLAEQYLNERRPNGKRRDPEIGMYEDFGFTPTRVAPNGFQDNASLNFGVVFKVDVPPANLLKHFKPVRKILASSLRRIAKHPEVLQRVL